MKYILFILLLAYAFAEPVEKVQRATEAKIANSNQPISRVKRYGYGGWGGGYYGGYRGGWGGGCCGGYGGWGGGYRSGYFGGYGPWGGGYGGGFRAGYMGGWGWGK